MCVCVYLPLLAGKHDSDDEHAGADAESIAVAVQSHLQQVIDALGERRSAMRTAGLTKLVKLLQKFYLPAVFGAQ